MAKWIQHYRDGHYAEVWQEMQSLGADIGRPAHAKAAREVAHETMQRARQNVLSLIDGLLELGYRFDGPAEPTTPDYPLELRIASTLDYVRLSGGKRYRADPWSHPAFAWLDEEDVELPSHHRNGKPARATYRPPSSRTASHLDRIEQSLGTPLSLGVREWFEVVGPVNLAGKHPFLNRNGATATLRVILDPAASVVASDPSAGADFVASIRHAFEWAGFPGWAGQHDPPERELSRLRSKLLPL
jgi:hypothetical protein